MEGPPPRWHLAQVVLWVLLHEDINFQTNQENKTKKAMHQWKIRTKHPLFSRVVGAVKEEFIA